MWTRKQRNIGGSSNFFVLALSHTSLGSYYQLIFSMKQHHNWSIHEIEEMLPWERDIYTTMLTNWIKEENDKIREQNTNG